MGAVLAGLCFHVDLPSLGFVLCVVRLFSSFATHFSMSFFSSLFWNVASLFVSPPPLTALLVLLFSSSTFFPSVPFPSSLLWDVTSFFGSCPPRPFFFCLHRGAAFARNTMFLLANNSWKENAVTGSCGGARNVNFSLPGGLTDLGQSAVGHGDVAIPCTLSLLLRRIADRLLRHTGGSWCGGGAMYATNCTLRWSNNTWAGNVVSDVGNGGSVRHAAAVDMVNGGMFHGGGGDSFFFPVLGLSWGACMRNPALPQAARCGWSCSMEWRIIRRWCSQARIFWRTGSFLSFL